jgi:hypothetical protein
VHGSDIAKSLIKNRRDIAEQLLQSKLDTVRFLSAQSTNLPLIHALNIEGRINIETIFTDLDAAIGDATIGRASSLRVSGLADFEIEDSSWVEIKRIVRVAEQCLGSILVKPISEIEISHANDVKEATMLWTDIERDLSDVRDFAALAKLEIFRIDTELKRLMQRQVEKSPATIEEEQAYDKFEALLKGAIDDAAPIKRHVTEVEGRAKRVLRNSNPRAQSESLLRETETLAVQIRYSQSRLQDRQSTFVKAETNITIPRQIQNLELFAEKALAGCSVAIHRSKSSLDRVTQYLKLTNYKLAFDTLRFNEALEREIKSLVHKFSSSEVSHSKDYARRLLEETKSYLSALRAIGENSILSGLLQQSEPLEKNSPRLGACILGLLDSGVDVLVTGGAGSGKSTTLEIFAMRSDRLRALNEVVVFLPLAKVAAPPLDKKLTPLDHLFSEIARIYRLKLPGVTSKNVMQRVDEARKLTIVFDGIDEAMQLITWLASVVDELRKRKDQVHIVTSSRFSVPELSERDFLRIELLPFRPEQVRRFVHDFLKDEVTLVTNVLSHLDANPSMFSVVKTPIMNTILCALAKSGVMLPSTRNALYKERFELLWGAYDAKKMVQRIKSRKECLEDVSKRVAYYLHTRHIRSAPRDDVAKYLVDSLSRKYAHHVIFTAFDELRVPCNVLLDELDGTLGFGHLSYQEYLVSEELYTNRQSEIVSHLGDPWWREVLVLIAMKTEDIGSILEDRILQSGVVGSARATLKAMIEVASPNQRSQLRKLLRDHERLDYLAESDDS